MNGYKKPLANVTEMVVVFVYQFPAAKRKAGLVSSGFLNFSYLLFILIFLVFFFILPFD